jgi:GNAT superfamily N-acetyltransferase
MSITIRQATIADKAYVMTAITEAEKSGGNTVSYCNLLGITEQEFSNMLSNMLDEEIEGQELYIPGFLIASVDGIAAAASCSWVEQSGNMASSTLKSNLLMYHTNRSTLLAAMPAIAALKEVNIDRTPGALQIESIYTSPHYRGKGLTGMLINEHIAQHKTTNPAVNKAQITLLGCNEAARSAYSKVGFVLAQEKKSDNPIILKLLSCDRKIMMEKTIN